MAGNNMRPAAILRLFAVVTFLAPLLGLFGILRLATMAMIPAAEDPLYDVGEDGTKVSLRSAWKELQLSEVPELFRSRLATWTYAFVPILLVFSHFLICMAIWKKCRAKFSSLEALYTFICPPLFPDWEDYYRWGKSEDMLESWRRSKAALACHIILHSAENLILCMPIVLLKIVATRRTSAMADKSFALLPLEAASVGVIDGLLAGSVVLHAVVIPALQALLAFIYFKFGHAWSRALKAREAKSQKTSESTTSNESTSVG